MLGVAARIEIGPGYVLRLYSPHELSGNWQVTL